MSKYRIQRFIKTWDDEFHYFWLDVSDSFSNKIEAQDQLKILRDESLAQKFQLIEVHINIGENI